MAGELRRIGVRAALIAIIALVLLMWLDLPSFVEIAFSAALTGVLFATVGFVEVTARNSTSVTRQGAAALLAWGAAVVALGGVAFEVEYAKGVLSSGSISGGLTGAGKSLDKLNVGNICSSFTLTFAFAVCTFSRLRRWSAAVPVPLALVANGLLSVASSGPVYTAERALSADAALVTPQGFALILFIASVPFAFGVPLVYWLADLIDARLGTVESEPTAARQAGETVHSPGMGMEHQHATAPTRRRRFGWLCLIALLAFGVAIYALASPGAVAVEARWTSRAPEPGHELMLRLDSPRWGSRIANNINVTRIVVDGADLNLTTWRDPRGTYPPNMCPGPFFGSNGASFPFRHEVLRGFFLLAPHESKRLRVEGDVLMNGGALIPFSFDLELDTLQRRDL